MLFKIILDTPKEHFSVDDYCYRCGNILSHIERRQGDCVCGYCRIPALNIWLAVEQGVVKGA